MLRDDILYLLESDYLQAVGFLKNKYGACKYDYFYNENCASENAKAQRSSEGIFLHHIDEDKYMNLSSRKIAKQYPYAAQRAEKLVYCNYLEHLLLHIKIFENYLAGKCKQPATNGIFLFIVPELNTFYCTNQFQKNYNKAYGEVIKDNFEEYLLILKRFLKISKPKFLDDEVKRRRKCYGATKTEYLCRDSFGNISPKIQAALKRVF